MREKKKDVGRERGEKKIKSSNWLKLKIQKCLKNILDVHFYVKYKHYDIQLNYYLIL